MFVWMDDGIGERVFLSVEANLVLSGNKTVCCGLVLVIIYIRLYAIYASNLKQWDWGRMERKKHEEEEEDEVREPVRFGWL